MVTIGAGKFMVTVNCAYVFHYKTVSMKFPLVWGTMHAISITYAWLMLAVGICSA